MIPAINIPGAKEAAKETTEEMRRAFHSFYSQVSCTDLSAIQAPDCTPLKRGGDGDGEGAVSLDWRADPFVSMSDLTLVVYDGSGGVPYHVHTLLLAYGGRKSGFIAEQIKNQQNRNPKSSGRSGGGGDRRGALLRRQNSSGSKENENGNGNAEYKVDIYVPALAARHVPLFLDYVYGAPPKLSTATAPALRYLSNRFDCRDLHKEATSRFIPQDLELSTAPQYCAMADELKDFELRDKSIRIMAERFEKVSVGLLRRMNPRMMRMLLQSERLECGSESLSVKVAEYLRLRDEVSREDNAAADGNNPTSTSARERIEQFPPLTDEDFYWMTHCQHMPKISPKEALFYFNYGTRFPQVWNEVGSGSLKSRCLAACSDSWAMDRLTSHLERTELNPLELYDTLEPKMKVELLESTLVGARKLMADRERQSGRRAGSDRDARMSEEIMYENNRESSSSASEGVAKAVVLGAGVAPANGVYLCKVDRSHASNGSSGRGGRQSTIIYEKEAVWDQQRVTFVMYPADSGQYYTQYKLGVRTRQNGDDRKTRILYNSPTVVGAGGGGAVIPEQAWEVEDATSAEGVHPPPRFVGRIEGPGQSTWNKNMKHSLP